MDPTNIQNWTELGVAMATLVILFFVVKWFCQSLDRKDAAMNKIIGDFNVTMTNHITHEISQREKETNAIDKLSEVIERLLIKLDR
jgi:hypothetical protein